MKRSFHFIQETSSRHKRRVVFITLLAILIIVGTIIAFSTVFHTWLTTSYFGSFTTALENEIKSVSPAGLFYAGFVLGLFFVPLPQEPLFYLGLIKGNPIILSIVLVNAGYLLAQVVNYFVGSKLSTIIVHLVSKKSLYKARRIVNKYGGFGVFIFNALPLPAPLLTLGLGITRYNVYRLFFYTILGVGVKYAFMAGFFLLTS